VVTQSVYNRASWMTLRQTDNILAQAEAQYRDAQIALMVDTTDAYFGVLRAADLVTVQASLVRANERQLEQSRQRFEVGWLPSRMSTTAWPPSIALVPT
jgi:outer membrane protein